MKKIINISIFCAFIVSLSSCDSDNKGLETETIIENEVASFEDYFNFLNTETNGSIIIQSMDTPLSNESFAASSSIKGNKAPLTLKVGGKVVSFTNYQYSDVAKKSYSNLKLDDMSEVFGNTFKVDLNSQQVNAKKSNKNSTPENLVESVYIPELIRPEYSGLENGKIVVGSQINWNLDSLNKNGVVLGLEYNPLSQIEEGIVNQKSERLLTGVTLEDIGFYTVTAEDLAQFPSNAVITLYVGRAGYNIAVDDNGLDYSLAGLSVSRADLQIQK